jgi:hypothetical protein
MSYIDLEERYLESQLLEINEKIRAWRMNPSIASSPLETQTKINVLYEELILIERRMFQLREKRKKSKIEEIKNKELIGETEQAHEDKDYSELLKCPICHSNIKDVKLSCGHMVCKTCSIDVIKVLKMKCPLCRAISTELKEVKYKNKYLKYKMKYFQLKNN